MENITADIPKGGLSPDSFSGLMVEANEYLAQRAEEIEQNKIETLISLRAQLNDGIIEPDQYEKAKKDIELSAKEQLSNAYIEAVDFEIGTVNTNYQDELNKAKDDFATDTADWVNDILSKNTEDMEKAFDDIESGVAWGIDGVKRISADPVSYTHLDVYKRQALCRACKIFLTASNCEVIGWIGKQSMNI